MKKACLARLWQCTLSSEPFICQQCTSHMLGMEDSRKGATCYPLTILEEPLMLTCLHAPIWQSMRKQSEICRVCSAVLPSGQPSRTCLWCTCPPLMGLLGWNGTSIPYRHHLRGALATGRAWKHSVQTSVFMVSETMKVPPDKNSHTAVANRVQVNLTKKGKKESMDKVNSV